MELIVSFFQWIWATFLVNLYGFLLKILKVEGAPADDSLSEVPLETATSEVAQRTMLSEPEPAPPARKEDLQVIEGIGPKIAGVLQAAGIGSFKQLAQCKAEQLEQVLKDAGVRLANPATWPEQARLAARGDWSGLAALKAQLKGGRKA
ncbi:MAG: DUF4332 domain-containing protein [Chloroflexi bacterium]|nr:DUF4332 domain-containing protein [Chloroflexota bacterium]